MNANIHWVLELAIKDGELDNFKALMAEMVAHTQSTQPDTTHYEWLFNDDGTVCHIYERYTDNAAAILHLQGFGELWAERFLAAVDPTRLTLYGPANAELRAITDGFGAAYLELGGGFARV